MRHAIVKGRVSYEPNTLGGGCPMQRPWEQGGFVSHPEAMEGNKIRARSPSFADHFSQPALFWRSQSKWEQDHIVAAFCFELAKVEVPAIRERMVATLTQVDAALARRVSDGLGMKLPAPPIGFADVPYTDKPEIDKALSMADVPNTSIAGRKIAVLVNYNVDSAVVNAVRKALEAQGAVVKLLAPKLGPITSNEGKVIQADHSLPTVSSVLFDAVFIPGDEVSANGLCCDANAVLFVKEAYKHGKAIAASDGGIMLLNKAAKSAGAVDDEFKGPGIVVDLGETVDKAFIERFIGAIKQHRFYERVDLDLIVA